MLLNAFQKFLGFAIILALGILAALACGRILGIHWNQTGLDNWQAYTLIFYNLGVGVIAGMWLMRKPRNYGDLKPEPDKSSRHGGTAYLDS